MLNVKSTCWGISLIIAMCIHSHDFMCCAVVIMAPIRVARPSQSQQRPELWRLRPMPLTTAHSFLPNMYLLAFIVRFWFLTFTINRINGPVLTWDGIEPSSSSFWLPLALMPNSLCSRRIKRRSPSSCCWRWYTYTCEAGDSVYIPLSRYYMTPG